MDKQDLVDIMMEVQLGTRSCRHAATEIAAEIAEIAALEAEVERLQKERDLWQGSSLERCKEVERLAEAAKPCPQCEALGRYPIEMIQRHAKAEALREVLALFNDCDCVETICAHVYDKLKQLEEQG